MPWTLEDLVGPLRDDRVAALRGRLIDGSVSREEVIEMIKVVEQRSEYYHNHYWGVVVKAVIAVLAMIALPYVIRVDTGALSPVAAVFPAVSLLVAGFCVVALKSEEARLNNYELKLSQLSQTLDETYTDYDPSAFTKVGIFQRLNKYRAANLVLFLFIVLALIGLMELVMIVTGNFVF